MEPGRWKRHMIRNGNQVKLYTIFVCRILEKSVRWILVSRVFHCITQLWWYRISSEDCLADTLTWLPLLLFPTSKRHTQSRIEGIHGNPGFENLTYVFEPIWRSVQNNAQLGSLKVEHTRFWCSLLTIVARFLLLIVTRSAINYKVRSEATTGHQWWETLQKPVPLLKTYHWKKTRRHHTKMENIKTLRINHCGCWGFLVQISHFYYDELLVHFLKWDHIDIRLVQVW